MGTFYRILCTLQEGNAALPDAIFVVATSDANAIAAAAASVPSGDATINYQVIPIQTNVIIGS